METNTLETRSSTLLGPYFSDMLLTIKKVGAAKEGTVHQLCAPVIYDYGCRQNKLLEVYSLPNAFVMKKNKIYLLSAFISSVEYSLSKI